MITGKHYDWLKWVAQVALPALGTLYFTLASIWGWSSGEEVVGTIMAIDLFLGVLLGISQKQYNKNIARGGDFMVFEGEDGSMDFSMALEAEPEELAKKQELHFKVQKKPKLRRHP